MNEHVTLMHPDARDPTARAISSGFPIDLLSQAGGLLRVLALRYAFGFFMAGIFPALLFPADRARFLGSFVQWGPSVLGIGVALLVAAVIRSPRLPLPTAMNLGLAFEIASSYAIAAAEFADPMGLEMHSGSMGLSWVAVWIVLFTVVVPTAPRRAVLAALASVRPVPVTIARLRSPHTVELFDFGMAADGAFYYVMELLDGLDADSLLRRFGPTPPERAIYLLRQVCHSLSEAQSCGLVHRDIKPANIFVCRYGEEYDFVKVLDFGIVRAVRDAADTNPVHTREHAIQGTPAFIAPEQAMGADLDGRADIYATGCLAYWFLTGQFVFTAETPMGLLVQHAQTPAAPPSARTDLPIPAALDELVLSCLAKDPANRPQSARELSLRLAEVDGASAWTQERAREWWTTHQLALP